MIRINKKNILISFLCLLFTVFTVFSITLAYAGSEASQEKNLIVKGGSIKGSGDWYAVFFKFEGENPALHNNFWGLDLLKSSDGTKTNGDLLKIDGRTFNELKAENPTQYERMIAFANSPLGVHVGFHSPIILDNAKTIEILAGFQWYYSPITIEGRNVNPETDTLIKNEGLYVKENVLLEKGETSWSRVLKRVDGDGEVLDRPVAENAIVYDGASCKTTYKLNEGLNTEGMKLTVQYQDGGMETVAVTPDMVSGFDSTSVGERQLTITYRGKVFQQSITIQSAKLESISIKTLPNKTEYELFETLDLTGLVVEASYDDGSKRELNQNEYSVIGDTKQSGEVSIEIVYLNKTADFQISVQADPYPEKSIFVDFSDSTFSASTGPNDYNQIWIKMGGIGVNTNVGDLWNVDKTDNGHNANYILINGKTISELNREIAPNAVNRVIQQGDKLRFHLDNDLFKYEQVNTVELKAGLQWYQGTNGGDDPNSYNQYQPIPGAVLKEDIILFNNTKTLKWERLILQKDTNPENWKNSAENFADNAIVYSPENVKAEYRVGEPLNVSGMFITVTYQDGKTEKVAVAESMITGFDSTQPVESQILTINYKGVQLTQEICITQVNLSSLTVEQEMDLLEYGLFEQVVLDGLQIRANYDDGSSVVLNYADLEYTFDTSKAGKSIVTFFYGSQSAEVEITVVDRYPDRDLQLEFKYDGNGADEIGNSETVYNNVVLSFDFIGMEKPMDYFWYLDKKPNTADKIKFNGVLVSDLIKQGKIERLVVAENRIRIHGDADHKITAVQSIEILPGFQFYTRTDTNLPEDSDNPDNLIPVPGAVVRNRIVVIPESNVWARQLKQNADGTGIAENAVVIEKNNVQTQYKVGERVNLEGISFKVNYEDGFTETITAQLDHIMNEDMIGFAFTESGNKEIILQCEGIEFRIQCTVAALDITGLTNNINALKAYLEGKNPELYTEESWKGIEDVIASANALIEKINEGRYVKDSDVEEMKELLSSKMNSLVEKEKFPTGLVVGLSVAGVIVIAGVVGFVLFMRKKNKKVN